LFQSVFRSVPWLRAVGCACAVLAWAPAAGAADLDALRRTAVVEAVERVAPSVVSITTEVSQTDPWLRRTRTSSSDGSGVVITPDGVILTNHHVVENARRITASFPDGRRYGAELVGTAPELDLAVLRIRPGAADPALTAVEVGASSELLLGEPVIAIGNPFGLGHTVTTGVVSAVSRPLETDRRVYQDFIQTDASINPGNSGGPLLDVTGRLIGINTAIRPDAEGIGFAIPVDRAVKVARDLILFGTVQVPWLGVDLDDIALRTPTGRRVAAKVARVHPDSPAARAGLTTGDLLMRVDEREIHGRADLNAHLAAFEPGQSFSLVAVRDRAALPVDIATVTLPEAVVDRVLEAVLGVKVADSNGGVRIEALKEGSVLFRSGARPGDRVVAVNGHPTPTVDALRRQVAQVKSGHRTSALLTLQRHDTVGRLTVPF